MNDAFAIVSRVAAGASPSIRAEALSSPPASTNRSSRWAAALGVVAAAFGLPAGQDPLAAPVGLAPAWNGLRAAHAADWYVDAAAPAAGSGRSRQAAWHRFADIDWSLLGPGDTLHIVGDACDPPYKETLMPAAAGREGAPLVIAGLSRTGNGLPVIDGENQRRFGVALVRRNHVTLRGLMLRNHAEAGVTVRGAEAGVLVEGNRIFSGDPGGGNARGIDARGNAGLRPLIVRANRYGTPPDTKAQTDGIWSSDNDGVVFEDNILIVSNNDSHGHSDGFQSFRDRTILVRRNWIEQANTAAHHNHGVWIENTRNGGVVEVSGNVVLAPNLTGDAVVAHFMREGWTEQGTVILRNNTIWGGRRSIYLENSPAAQVRDNIIVAAEGGHAAVVLKARPPPGSFDGNLLWAPSAAIAYLGDRNLSWAQWRGLGYDANGVNADPPRDPSGAPALRATARAGRGAAIAPPEREELAFANCPRRR